MKQELIFRATLALVSTLLLSVRLYYGQAARQSRGKIVIVRRRVWGTSLLWFFGLLGVMTASMYIIVPEGLKWAGWPLPLWLRWIGIGLGGITVLLFGWIHRALGKNWSMPVIIRDDHTLITNGPYRYVRHPMYSTIFIWALAYFLISANWLIGGSWLGLGLTAVAVAADEEDALIEMFGERYQAYIQRTGRFWPRFRPSSDLTL